MTFTVSISVNDRTQYIWLESWQQGLKDFLKKRTIMLSVLPRTLLLNLRNNQETLRSSRGGDISRYISLVTECFA